MLLRTFVVCTYQECSLERPHLLEPNSFLNWPEGPEGVLEWRIKIRFWSSKLFSHVQNWFNHSEMIFYLLQVNQRLSLSRQLSQNLPREYLGIYQNTSGIQIPSWVSQFFRSFSFQLQILHSKLNMTALTPFFHYLI